MNRKLYLLMHFLFDRFNPNDMYRKNFHDLFRNPDGKFIICVSESKEDLFLRETKSFIFNLNPNLKVDYIITEFSKCFPLDGWQYLFDRIRRIGPLEIIVGGANLSGDEEEGYGECVGYTYYMIKREFPNTKLDFRFCYPYRNITKP